MIDRKEFLDAWSSLTGKPPHPEQLAIMDHDEGPLQIIAGPGVGKTYTLILRISFLLCVLGIAPEAIILTTFTRRAAEELRSRLQETLSLLSSVFPHLSALDLSQMHLGTLHSLCWDILTQTPGSHFRHLQSLSALERAFFLRDTSSFGKKTLTSEEEEIQIASWIDKKQYRTHPSRWQWVKLLTTAYERLTNDQIDRVRFAAASPLYEKLIKHIDVYEAALSGRHFTDQTLLQQQALELLCAPEGAPWLQGISHVFVDEYQDTNPLQARIYRALAGFAPHNLCVVGDDDQALHRFRGGTVGCLIRFADECQHVWPGCEVAQKELLENHRSHARILEWCNGFIVSHPEMSLPHARVTGKDPLRAHSPHTSGPALLAIRGKNLKESASNFARFLHQLKEHEIIETYASCALLAYSFKKRRPGYAYVSELRQQNIPVAGPASQKEQPVYKQLLGTLFLLLDPAQNLLPMHFPKDNAAYVEQCRQAAETEPILSQMARQIHTWLLKEEKTAANRSLTKLAQRILNAEPIIAAIQHDPEAEAATQMLIQILDAYDRVVEKGWRIPLEDRPGVPGKKRIASWWMERLYYILVEGIQQEHLERGEDRLSRQAVDALSFLTIHSAKGLEFPIVALVVDDQNQASPKAEHQLERELYYFRQDLLPGQGEDANLLLGGTDTQRSLQDLVRLHYVGYTRAQQFLLLLITDDHLEQVPPALGLGSDLDPFRDLIEIWPPKEQKTRRSKKQNMNLIPQQGAEQNELWND